jgi:hypothetical protein
MARGIRKTIGRGRRQMLTWQRRDIWWITTTILVCLAGEWVLADIILSGVWRGSGPSWLPEPHGYERRRHAGRVGTIRVPRAILARTEPELRYEFLDAVRQSLASGTLDANKIEQLERMARALNAPQAASNLESLTPPPPDDDESTPVPSHA